MKKALHALLPAGLRAGVLIAVAVFLGGGWVKGAVPASGQVSTRHLYLPFVSNSVPPVSGLALIEKALEAGQIDYPTSLLYRAYTQFDDARLPSAYRGNMVQEDSTLYQEYNASAGTLPASIKTLLSPFMVRPDMATSAWSVYAAAHVPSSVQGNAVTSCTGQWASAISTAPGVNAKVWATCDANSDADITYVLGLINDLWKPETDLMGQPIPDLGGPDNGGGPEIDFYLVYPLTSAIQGRINQIPSGAVGVTWASSPYTDFKSSAYILLPRDLKDSPDFKDTIAHEFFHVLQAAHNATIQNQKGKVWWFNEASATWAGLHFVPQTSAIDHTNYRNRFNNDYQHSKLSLNVDGVPGSVDWDHLYMAYIWPYFMDQELGPQAIVNVWNDIEYGSSSFTMSGADAMKVIDKILPFKDNFYRFAVRNLNLDLEPGNPINPRFVDHDPNFPDGLAPLIMNDPVGNQGEILSVGGLSNAGKTVSLSVPSLVPVYYHYAVPANGQQVEITLPQTPNSTIQLSLLAKARGGAWSQKDLTGMTKVKLCNVEELFLAIGNINLTPMVTAPASYTIRALDLPCTCSELAQVQQVSGTVTFSYQHSGSSSTHSYQLDQKGSAQFTMPQGSSGPGGVDFWGDATSGTGSIHDVDTDYNSYGPPSVTKVDGDGPAIKPAYLDSPMANLNVNLDKCTFDFDATIYLDMTETDPSGVTTAAQERVGTVKSDDYYPLVVTTPATTLSGSGNFPAHSLSWGYLNPGNAYFPGSGVDNYFVSGIMTDGSAGSASVSWTFTAQIPPP
ncbi:MAG: hypothetical protein M1132_12525 [Chloroflexi bacterium]|nr:hypothetical protein [Chloroflexota bacterium]